MILITNVKGSSITVDDLGIYLENNESLDIEDLFTSEEILSSQDLEPALNSFDITAEINGNSATWNDIVAYFKRLTEAEHEILDTLTHDLNENLFFESVKDSNGQTQSIVYYTDSSKLLKVREEEITRDLVGRAQIITVSQYDSNGNIIKRDIQTINRTAEGTLDNITQVKV